jgi:hypothetical protein
VPKIVYEGQDAVAFDPDDEFNGVYVLSPWPYDPSHIALTFPRRTLRGEITSADVVFNGDVTWGVLPEDAEPPPGTHDIASILSHELGHVLGLDESEVEGATMWPASSLGETHKRLLTGDDEAGVMYLYATDLPPETAASCSLGASSPGGRRGAEVSTWVFLALVAAYRLRRSLLPAAVRHGRGRAVVDSTRGDARSATRPRRTPCADRGFSQGIAN